MNEHDLITRHPLLTADDLVLLRQTSPRVRLQLASHIEKLRAEALLHESMFLEAIAWHEKNVRLLFDPAVSVEDGRRIWETLRRAYAYLSYHDQPQTSHTDHRADRMALQERLELIVQSTDMKDILPSIIGDTT